MEISSQVLAIKKKILYNPINKVLTFLIVNLVNKRRLSKLKQIITDLNDLTPISDALGISVEEYFRQLILQQTFNSKEVAERLSVKPARIVALKHSGKLSDAKGLFIKKEVEKMRLEQISSKYGISSKEYSITPCFFTTIVDGYGEAVFISNTRFNDCITLSKSNDEKYVEALKELLMQMCEALKKNQPIFYLTEDVFRELSNSHITFEDIQFYEDKEILFYKNHKGLPYYKLKSLLQRNFSNIPSSLADLYRTLEDLVQEKYLNDIEHLLIKLYEFDQVTYESEYEMGIIFKGKQTTGDSTFVRVQKGIGNIYFKTPEGWKKDASCKIPTIFLS